MDIKIFISIFKFFCNALIILMFIELFLKFAEKKTFRVI